MATSKNGIVDASKTMNKNVQNIPESTVKLGLNVVKKTYLDDEND